METTGRISMLAVGPQRTASSWIDRALRQHPSLSLPQDVKETFFFDRFYEKGWDWYLSHFTADVEGLLRIEVGSTYFESLSACERIYQANPDTKILVTVRNPIARSFSSYGHEYAKGRTGGDFFEAVETSPRIVDSGRYAVLSPVWQRQYGNDQLLYIVQEDIEVDPQGQLDRICEFLGIDTVALPDDLLGRYGQGTVPSSRYLAAIASRTASALRTIGLHKVVEAGKRLGLKRIYSGGNPGVLEITPPVFEYLLAEHHEDICFLEDLLGRSFEHWRKPETYGLDT